MHAKVKRVSGCPVSLAMRYGNPSLLSGLQELHDQGVTEVMLFPLYQHAMASTTTILELAEDHRKSIFQK
jgi:ferrochelatase